MFKIMAYYYFSSKCISQSHLFVVFPLLVNIDNWFCRGKRKERQKVSDTCCWLISAHPGQSSLWEGNCHSAGCDIHTLHQKPCPNAWPPIILWPFRFHFSYCTGCSYNPTSFISHYVFLIGLSIPVIVLFHYKGQFSTFFSPHRNVPYKRGGALSAWFITVCLSIWYKLNKYVLDLRIRLRRGHIWEAFSLTAYVNNPTGSTADEQKWNWLEII